MRCQSKFCLQRLKMFGHNLLTASRGIHTGQLCKGTHDAAIHEEHYDQPVEQSRGSALIDDECKGCQDANPAVADAPSDRCNLKHTDVSFWLNAERRLLGFILISMCGAICISRSDVSRLFEMRQIVELPGRAGDSRPCELVDRRKPFCDLSPTMHVRSMGI